MLVGIYLRSGRAADLPAEWGFILFNLFIVAAPFLLLTALGVMAKLPWLVGVALTALFWGYVFLDMVLITPGPGANIGLGLISFVWPLVVAGGALGAAKLGGLLPDRAE